MIHNPNQCVFTHKNSLPYTGRLFFISRGAGQGFYAVASVEHHLSFSPIISIIVKGSTVCTVVIQV